jgi:phenylalanyl-tRNA synthetase alpha chain
MSGFTNEFAAMDLSKPLDYEQIVLNTLAKDGVIADTWDLALSLGVDHQVLVGVIKSLLADAYVLEELLSTTYWMLTEEGARVAESGAPEVQVFNAVPEGGALLKDVQASLGDAAKVGVGQCMKNKWLKKEGETLLRLVPSVADSAADALRAVRDGDAAGVSAQEAELKALKKRKLAGQVTRKSSKITKGGDFQTVRVRKVADLTKAMLGNKAEMAPGTHWSQLGFKAVNLKAMGAPAVGGNFHPLLKVRAEFRRILMEMGFEEMPTSKWVESSFWNFDALFQPQVGVICPYANMPICHCHRIRYDIKGVFLSIFHV